MTKVRIEDIHKCECCGNIRNDVRFKKEFQKLLCRECYRKFKYHDKPRVWDKVEKTGRKAYVNIKGEVVRVVDF